MRVEARSVAVGYVRLGPVPLLCLQIWSQGDGPAEAARPLSSPSPSHRHSHTLHGHLQQAHDSSKGVGEGEKQGVQQELFVYEAEDEVILNYVTMMSFMQSLLRHYNVIYYSLLHHYDVISYIHHYDVIYYSL